MEFRILKVLLMTTFFVECLCEPDMPQECTGMSYCTVKSDSYPSDEFIDKILDRAKLKSISSETILSGRQGNDLVKYKLCQEHYAELIIYHLEHNGVVKDVLQRDGSFRQPINVVTCKSPGLLADGYIIKEEYIDAYNVRCEEVTATHNLIVIDSEQKLTLAPIVLPVGCVCKYDAMPY